MEWQLVNLPHLSFACKIKGRKYIRIEYASYFKSKINDSISCQQPCRFGDQAKGSGEKSERPTKKSKKTSRVSAACLSATHLEKMIYFNLRRAQIPPS